MKIEGFGGIGNKLLVVKENVVVGWIMFVFNGFKFFFFKKKKMVLICCYVCGNCENRERERERKVCVCVCYVFVLLSCLMVKFLRCESY